MVNLDLLFILHIYISRSEINDNVIFYITYLG